MKLYLAAALVLALRPALPGEEAGPPGEAGGAEAASDLPTAAFKTPNGQIKFQQGLKKLSEEDYPGARELFVQCQKEATGPEDRKVVQGVIDDCRLGPEIEAARALIAKKEERSALAKLEKLLREHPRTFFRPKAEKAIREAEELIYLIFDDFETGDSLPSKTTERQAGAKKKGLARFLGEQSFNSDPQYVRHGKGSLKWRLGEAGNLQKKLKNLNLNLNNYLSPEIKSPIAKWKQLVFWLHLPEEDEGVLQVALSPRSEIGAGAEIYGQKPIDLHGKRGWLEVRLDLKRDFGSTHPVKIEDVRFVLINITKPRDRTIYMDFVHLE